MANSAIATPTILTDPGFLYWAPLGSTMPTNTAAGSVYTDTWPVAWLPFGMTEAGSTIIPATTVEPINAAETFDPIAWRTTGRTCTVAFMIKSFTATQLSRAMNGATLTVTGSGATTSTKVTPVNPGSEVRCMIGWESLDSTARFVGYQCINSGDLALTMAKAPANTNIPWNANLEKPTSTQPFELWFAGAARG